jgi:hypothetical protein
MHLSNETQSAVPARFQPVSQDRFRRSRAGWIRPRVVAAVFGVRRKDGTSGEMAGDAGPGGLDYLRRLGPRLDGSAGLLAVYLNFIRPD